MGQTTNLLHKITPPHYYSIVVLWLRIYRISNEFFDYFSLKKSQSNKLKLKTTIGKLFSGKANLSYGSSLIIQMPMRYPTGFV
jgi:hypothetical protein